MSSTQDATSQYIKHRGIRINKKMDVTFVLEESGVTATVEVPCEANVAAAKEVACTALAVSPASVEMRIGTQVLEETCRLQDTAFGAGVQVVLACPRFANIKCPAEYSVEAPTGGQRMDINRFSLSPCGALCLFTQDPGYVTGLDTETFSPAFEFKVDIGACGALAISRCKTRCYMASMRCLAKVALPGGEVLRKVDGTSYSVFACGGVVVSRGQRSCGVYDENLTLLRSLSHEGCSGFVVSDCGGWMITSSRTEKNARLWDVNTGEAVACVPATGRNVALSRRASVFAVVHSDKVQLYDWSGAALGSFEQENLSFICIKFTPCGKYLVVQLAGDHRQHSLHQYDVATMSCVRVFSDVAGASSFVISPCSRAVAVKSGLVTIVTRHLYPY